MTTALIIVLALFGLLIGGGFFYSVVLPLQPFAGEIGDTGPEVLASARRLEQHVRAVASRPHNIAHYEALLETAAYIEQQLRSYGYEPLSHAYMADEHEVRNIEVVLEPDSGSNAATCVIGAHYDAPDDSPGANDNGTGVAALLEVARALAAERRNGMGRGGRRLRLVFFVNEEQPYGKTELMGSWRHARDLAQSGEAVAGMIALETLGYFSDDAGSQNFPFPFGLIYPDIGNFVAFVGLPGSRGFLHEAIAAFRAHAAFPSIGGVAPGFLEGIDLSDHWAYREFGFPALMITDTAPFRNPYYHEPHDLPETVDYESLARITRGLVAMARELTR